MNRFKKELNKNTGMEVTDIRLAEIALQHGYTIESDDRLRFICQENFAGGKYACYIIEDGFVMPPSKLTNNIDEAFEFVN